MQRVPWLGNGSCKYHCAIQSNSCSGLLLLLLLLPLMCSCTAPLHTGRHAECCCMACASSLAPVTMSSSLHITANLPAGAIVVLASLLATLLLQHCQQAACGHWLTAPPGCCCPCCNCGCSGSAQHGCSTAGICLVLLREHVAVVAGAHAEALSATCVAPSRAAATCSKVFADGLQSS